MREILFRAKAIDRQPDREYRTNYKNGDWVFGLWTKPFDDRFPHLKAEMRNTDGVEGISIDHNTLGQYTGMIDKNGVKIFEGDIVCYKEEYYTVSFDECCFQIYGDGLCFGMEHFYGHELEVIGNVYDNYELLEVESK